MKFKVIKNRENCFTIEDIVKDDILWKNLSGNPEKSKSKFNRTSRYMSLRIEDPSILDFFAANNVQIGEWVNPESGEARHSLYFKFYEKCNPKVVLVSSQSKDRLSVDELGVFDKSVIKIMDIRFHLYVAENGSIIPALDEIWATLDESSAYTDFDDFDKKYDYHEEMPFR